MVDKKQSGSFGFESIYHNISFEFGGFFARNLYSFFIPLKSSLFRKNLQKRRGRMPEQRCFNVFKSSSLATKPRSR